MTTDEATQLLAQARESSAGWTRADLDRLYAAFGFVITPGMNHDIVKHPEYPQLRATLTRGDSLAMGCLSHLRCQNRRTKIRPGSTVGLTPPRGPSYNRT